MKKKYWRVGYSYFPHEMLVGCSYIVYGTKNAAMKWLRDEIKKEPEWVQDQIDEFDSKSRTAMFINEQKIIEL